jgi:xanthine dehydrogenase accessory factor
MMRVWETLASLVAEHGHCAMVTIIGIRGSAPREEGARLFVVEGGRYRGTIGGGALEWRAIAEAQSMLAAALHPAKVIDVVLGPDLGQCCGGQVRLLVERFAAEAREEIDAWAALEREGPFATMLGLSERGVQRAVVADARDGPAVERHGDRFLERFGDRRRPLHLFGAGHVGRALVLALAPLPFAVTWIDGRPDAFPSAFPMNATARLSEDPARELDEAPDSSFVLAMTHSHALDFDIVLRALRTGRFPYVGVIGSATKRARFLSRLRQAGIPSSRLAELVCPLGDAPLRSKLPAAIAASVAVELLLRDEALRASMLEQGSRKAG